MTLATDLQDDIAELLDDPDVGRAIMIARLQGGAYNPADGSTGAVVPLTWTTRGLLLNYNDKLIDHTNIKQGDRRLYLKIKSIIYQAAIGDKVTAGADLYTVVNFKTIELGGTVVIYILQVRR